MCHIEYTNGKPSVYKHTGTLIPNCKIGARKPDGGHQVTFPSGDTRVIYMSETPPKTGTPIRPSTSGRASWADSNINPARPRVSAFWHEKSR